MEIPGGITAGILEGIPGKHSPEEFLEKYMDESQMFFIGIPEGIAAAIPESISAGIP